MKATATPAPFFPFDRKPARLAKIAADLARIDATTIRMGNELLALDQRRRALIVEQKNLSRRGARR